MGYMDIANAAPVRKKSYLDIANTAPSKKVVEKPDLYSALGAKVTPEMESDSPVLSAIAKTAQEGIVTPAAHYVNQALLNAPRSLLAKKGISYPEPETAAGQVLAKGAGVAGAMTSPVLKGIMGLAKGGGLLKQAVAGGAKGAAIGGLYSPEDFTDIEARKKQAIFGGAIGAGTGAIGGVLDKVSKYPSAKTLSIREKAKLYAKSEYDAYGNAIDSLKTTGKPLEHGPLFQNATDLMMKRNLYNPLTQQWAKPINKVDGQLLRSYTELGRKANSGKTITVGDVVKEWRKIRDSAKNDFEARKVANEFLAGIRNQIDDKVFRKANTRYANFKNEMELLDKHLGTSERNPLLTEKGEKFISGGMGSSEERRRVAEIVSKRLGESMKGGKVLSGLSKLSKSPLFKTALSSGIIGAGAMTGLSRIKK